MTYFSKLSFTSVTFESAVTISAKIRKYFPPPAMKPKRRLRKPKPLALVSLDKIEPMAVAAPQITIKIARKPISFKREAFSNCRKFVSMKAAALSESLDAK